MPPFQARDPPHISPYPPLQARDPALGPKADIPGRTKDGWDVDTALRHTPRLAAHLALADKHIVGLRYAPGAPSSSVCAEAELLFSRARPPQRDGHRSRARCHTAHGT